MLALRDLHILCWTNNCEGIETDVNRTVQGLVTMVDAKERPILTVRLFAESTLSYEVSHCYGEKLPSFD